MQSFCVCCISVASPRFLSRNAKVAAVFAAQLHRWRRLTGFDERQKEQTHNDVSCQGFGSFALAGYQKIHLQKHRLNCPGTKIPRRDTSPKIRKPIPSIKEQTEALHTPLANSGTLCSRRGLELSILPGLGRAVAHQDQRYWCCLWHRV